jgi:hypothetical protein
VKKFLLCILLTITATSSKAEVVLNWVDSGWYNVTGDHTPTNNNYIAGICADCSPSGTDFRNFFVFDTSSVAGQVTSAKLRLNTGFIATSGTYNLFDVTTPVATLVAGGNGQVAIYQDLGQGVSYGTTNLLTSQSEQIIEITLNAASIAAINMSNQLFALGGSYASAGFHAFGGTNANEQRQLVLNFEPVAVPIPGTIALFGLGLLGFCLRASNLKTSTK